MGENELYSSRGRVKPNDALVSVKIIGILFATMGCPFTNEMIDNLIRIYDKLNAEKKVLEIVYCPIVSHCTTEEEEQFIGRMPWLSLPHEDSRLFTISKKFEVKNKLRLILLSQEECQVLNANAEKAFHLGEGEELFQQLLGEEPVHAM